MLTKLRPLWKAITRIKSKNREKHGRHTTAPVATPSQTNFFTLPAELRNGIYDHAARDITLRLGLRSYKKVPALLLTSRQCRADFLPVLLATAPIEADITNFDFSYIVAITQRLQKEGTEIKALRTNPGLVLRLICSQDDSERKFRTWMENFHDWLKYKAAGFDSLPWHYTLLEDASCCGEGDSCAHCVCTSVIMALRKRVDELEKREIEMIGSEIFSAARE